MKKFTIFIITFIYALIFPLNALAESINLEITANGADSQSAIQTSIEQETQIVQTNQAEVNNQVNIEANTGDNQVDANTDSEISLNTGDVNSDVQITNQTNQNTLELDTCCQSGNTDILIAANGANSQNQVSTQTTTTITTLQANQATINNTITTTANTGQNTISHNQTPHIALATGDITQQTQISNDVNSSAASVQTGHSQLIVTIKANATDSDNRISVSFQDRQNSHLDNLAQVNNSIINSLNTGRNLIQANSNAVVNLQTGNIISFNTISNLVNSITQIINNCCQVHAEEPGGDTDLPSDDQGRPDEEKEPGEAKTNPNAESNKKDESNNEDQPSSAEGRGGYDGVALPATGPSTQLLLANFLLLLTGISLRFQPWKYLTASLDVSVTILI